MMKCFRRGLLPGWIHMLTPKSLRKPPQQAAVKGSLKDSQVQIRQNALERSWVNHLLFHHSTHTIIYPATNTHTPACLPEAQRNMACPDNRDATHDVYQCHPQPGGAPEVGANPNQPWTKTKMCANLTIATLTKYEWPLSTNTWYEWPREVVNGESDTKSV
jgi:hypothetical protein